MTCKLAIEYPGVPCMTATLLAEFEVTDGEVRQPRSLPCCVFCADRLFWLAADTGEVLRLRPLATGG